MGLIGPVSTESIFQAANTAIHFYDKIFFGGALIALQTDNS